MTTRAVIFDLFGTLARLTRDSRPYLQLCRRAGVPGRIRESLTEDAPTLLEFCRHLGISPPSDLADLERDLVADIASAEAYADVIPTLQHLRKRGVPMAVMSNLASPYRSVFSNLGFEEFISSAVFSCDIGLKKPDPAIYRHVLERLNVASSEALMVGDNVRCDVEGPQSIGIRAALLDRSGLSQRATAIQSLRQLDGMLT